MYIEQELFDGRGLASKIKLMQENEVIMVLR